MKKKLATILFTLALFVPNTIFAVSVPVEVPVEPHVSVPVESEIPVESHASTSVESQVPTETYVPVPIITPSAKVSQTSDDKENSGNSKQGNKKISIIYDFLLLGTAFLMALILSINECGRNNRMDEKDRKEIAEMQSSLEYIKDKVSNDQYKKMEVETNRKIKNIENGVK